MSDKPGTPIKACANDVLCTAPVIPTGIMPAGCGSLGGYDGAMDYAYQHAFGPSVYVDDDATWRDYVFAYPTVDGVIDTIQWEGFREGVDDVRYLTTLLQAIERGKATDGKAPLAQEAEEWVATMDPGGNLQALRATMVEYILKLNN